MNFMMMTVVSKITLKKEKTSKHDEKCFFVLLSAQYTTHYFKLFLPGGAKKLGHLIAKMNIFKVIELFSKVTRMALVQ